MNERTLRTIRIATVLAVLLMLVGAQQLGLLSQFADPAKARAALDALGPWGYVAFVLAFALLQPFGVPGTVFIMVAPLIWSWPIAYALSMVGTMAASVVGFAFARFVARDWVLARIPPRLSRYNEALEKRAFATVFGLRFLFWMPPWLHAFFGVSKVSFATHFWASLLAYALPLLATAYFGQRFFQWMRSAPPSVWALVAVSFALFAVVAWAVRRRRLARAADVAVL
jgi:uncharacterized membrane protein YdjX (TVP38/TMEM64 family)